MTPRRADLSIDVVIPSFRLDPIFLDRILALEVPNDAELHFYLVADDPGAQIPEEVARYAQRGNVTILRNERNLGAGGSRNRGLEAGRSDFVVFLDDDVEPQPDLLQRYADAIRTTDERVPGYVGVTRFPAPINSFTRGVVASDMLTFFDIAANRNVLTWGVTANLCLRRDAIGVQRFSGNFPPAGGGEDIDLCLRLLQPPHDVGFRCVRDAIVTHPWWGGGRRHYTRFFRWAFGDSALPTLHPRFRFRACPTLPEVLVSVVPAAVLLTAFGVVRLAQAVAFVVSMFVIDILIEFAKLRVRRLPVTLSTAAEAALIRFANECGRVVGHARRGRLSGMCERFDYFGTGESIAYEQRVAAFKLTGWAVAAALVVFV